MARVEQIAAGNLAAILQGTASGAAAALRAVEAANLRLIEGQWSAASLGVGRAEVLIGDVQLYDPGSGPRRAATITFQTAGPVQSVVIPGHGTLIINKYDGGAGKNGSQLTLDFDFNHSGSSQAYGVLQTVTTDSFQNIKTPYADPIHGPKYYTDGIAMVPRPDPSLPVYDLKTGTMVPGFQMLPSTAKGVLRFHDSPTNPVSATPLYGTLSFQTVVVSRPSDTPVVTITWGYSNQSSGFMKQPIVITPAQRAKGP